MPSSKRTRTSQTVFASALLAIALPAMPPATLPAAVAMVWPGATADIAAQPTSQYRPANGADDLLVWFASVPSAIDCTTPVPETPAPGRLAHAASSNATRKAIQ